MAIRLTVFYDYLWPYAYRVVTWLESIKSELRQDLSIQWKAFPLDQQNSKESPDFEMWEQPDYPSRGIPALVAGKAAKNQGERLFLKFHLAAFEADTIKAEI